ncbi:hypothetical protein LCGC14_1392230, partial [marine sediment metagenome]
MKKLLITTILIFLFMLGLSGAAWAESVTLAWNPNTESDLAGYKVYNGVASGVYGIVVDVKNVTQYTTSNLGSGTTYYWVVTAYDESGNESDYS